MTAHDGRMNDAEISAIGPSHAEAGTAAFLLHGFTARTAWPISTMAKNRSNTI